MKKMTITSLFAAMALIMSACGQGNVFSLEVGTCFNDASEDVDEVTDLPIVDCTDPHDNEVYYLFDLPDGGFPGLTAIQTAADEGCFDRFEGFVGRAWEDSTLEYWSLYPTEGSWDELDDREIVCVLYSLDGADMSGSMQGSGA